MKRIVAFLLMVPAWLSFADVQPLVLGDAANTGFADETAGDQQGGWIDLGGNDLRAMPLGDLSAAGVPFSIGAKDGKSGIVLGGPTRTYLPKTAVLEVPGVKAQCLYLLHAVAFPPAANELAGQIVVEYADGKTVPQSVRFGRDVADWHKATGYKNAGRSWTVYNGNTQVSLFTSKFVLKDEAVKSIRFESKEATWMIVGVSIGEDIPLHPIQPEFKVTRTFASPPPLTAPLPATTNDAAPRNVILIIGDGMGQGAIKLTSLYQHRADGQLVMQQFPFVGLCTTHSFDAEVTDSAASGTAFACGHKTKNGMLGMLPNKTVIESVATESKRAGRSVGIITTDTIHGATPSAFYAHVDGRGASQKIIDFLPECGFDVMIGNAAGKPWFLPKSEGGGRSDMRNVLAELDAKGYVQVTQIDAFRNAPEDKSVVGFMDLKTTYATESCTSELFEIAVSRLEKNPKGFFLMVEPDLADGGGHSNNADRSILGTIQTDWTARAAAEYARTHSDTLVIVTADHETGGINANLSYGTQELSIIYTTTSHTGTPVALYAFGPGAHRFSGVIDNIDIAKTIRALLK